MRRIPQTTVGPNAARPAAFLCTALGRSCKSRQILLRVHLMKHPFRTAALSAAVIATLGLSSAAMAGGRPDLVLAGLKAGKAHQAGELLVKFRDGTTAAQQAAVRQGMGAQKIQTVRGVHAKKGELDLLRLPAG